MDSVIEMVKKYLGKRRPTTELAEVLELSITASSQKLNGNMGFTVTDLSKIVRRYNVSGRALKKALLNYKYEGPLHGDKPI